MFEWKLKIDVKNCKKIDFAFVIKQQSINAYLLITEYVAFTFILFFFFLLPTLDATVVLVV